MRTIATGLLAAALSLAALDSSADEHWVDEVLLHDGRTIDVERSVAFHFGQGELSDAMRRWPDQYALRARNPDTGKALRWSGERNFNPILLDFHDKAAYLVILAESVFSNLKQYGCPEIPYVFFRYGEREGKWTQIPGSEFPKQLTRANLSARYDAMFMKGGKRQTREYIAGSYGHDVRTQESFATRTIPTDFASWKSAYKNQYRVSHYRDGCAHTVPSNVDPAHPQSPGQPSQDVALEILETKGYDPQWVIKGEPPDHARAWSAISWDAKRYAQCQALVKRVGDNSDKPELRGWLLFANDPTGTKKARDRSQMYCDASALWFTDYAIEPGRTVLTKFTIAGDFVYRASFAKPDQAGGYPGFMLYPTFRSEGGYLSFEWWNASQSGYDWRVKRSMKVRLREPAAR